MPGLVGVFRLAGVGEPRATGGVERAVSSMAVRGMGYRHVRYGDARLETAALLRPELDELAQPAHAQTGEVLLLDGAVHNAAELARASLPPELRELGVPALCAELLRKDPAVTVRELGGSYSLVYYDPRRGVLQLISDRLGSRPLYYQLRDGVLYFASELKAVLAARGGRAELDEQGVFQLAAFGHQLGARTLLRDVSVLPPGSVLTASPSGVEISRYWRPRYRPQRRGGDLSYRLAHAVVEATRRRAVGQRAPLGIFLSGGLDSRFIAGALAAVSPGPVSAFTFGRDDSRDVVFGRQLAELLGFSHHAFGYHSRDLAPSVPRVVWRTEGTQLFCDGLSIELHAELAPHARVMFNGHLGDALSGGHILPELLWLGRSQVAEHILRKRVALAPATLRHLCPPGRFDEHYRQLTEEVERELGEHDEERPALLYNLWDLMVRQRRYTLATPAVDRYLFEQESPFGDNDVVDVFLSMPLEELFGQRCYVRSMAQAFPAVAAVPWARTGRPIEASYMVRMARLAGDSALGKLRRKLGLRRAPSGMAHALGGLGSPELLGQARRYLESEEFPSKVLDRAVCAAAVDQHAASQDRFEEVSLLLTLSTASQLFLSELRGAPPAIVEPVLPASLSVAAARASAEPQRPAPRA